MPVLLQTFFSILWSVMSSRAGQLFLAFSIAWFWSGWKSDNYWKSIISAEKAAQEIAYQKEVSRQEEASRIISSQAAAKAEEDAKAMQEMKLQIEEFDKLEPVYVEKKIISPAQSNCYIDGNFSAVVRKLDAQARSSKAPKRPR